MSSITIPSSVISIGNTAFYGCTGLTSITIPSSVTGIGNYTFYGCTGLTSVTIGDGITSIGYNAFNGCKVLATMTVNATSVPTLGTTALPSTTLIMVPGVSLDDYKTAANWSDYASMIFCNDVKIDYDVTISRIENMSALHVAIGESNLENVVNLKVSGTINSYDLMVMRNKMINLRNLDLSDATLINNIYEHYTGYHSQNDTLTGYSMNVNLRTLKLPRNLKAITDYALSGCTMLSALEIPEGVTIIGQYAFQNCSSLTSIDVPDAVTSIGSSAFSGCAALKEMELPFVGGSESATATSSRFGYIFGTTSYNGGTVCNQNYYAPIFNKYPKYFFYIPSTLASVKIKRGVIPAFAFQNCTMLTKVEVPATVTAFRNYTFYGCTSLKKLTYSGSVSTGSIAFSDSLQNIGDYTFYDCAALDSLNIPARVTTMGNYAFQNCSKLQKCVLPVNSQLSAIPDYAFSGCTQLQRMDLPVSVQTIGAYAFQNCSAMTEVRIPTDMSSIGNYAFTGCTALNDVYTYTVEPQSIDQNTFCTYQTATLHYPRFSYYKYWYDTQWSQFLNLQEFDEDYSYVVIRKDFPLNTDDRGTIGGKPNTHVEHQGGFDITGGKHQDFSDLHLHHHDGSCGSILGHGDNVGCDHLFFDIEVEADKWYAFSFPFDVKLSDITKDGSWCFYRYDGDKRAGGNSGWDRMASDGKLNAGEGYIFSTNKAGTMSVKVDAPDMTGENKKTDLAGHGDTDTQTADKNWNFVGNRYTAYYDINEMDYTAPVVTFDGSAYSAYRPGDDDLILEPFQAFFVQKPSSVDDMNFDMNGRTTYLSKDEKKANSPARARKAARLSQNRQLINLVVSDGELQDKTRVVFNDEQSLDYEMECDASKFMSSGNVPLIYSLDSKNTRYAINERPQDDGTVRLGFIARKKGNFTIEAQRMDTPVLLYDAQTNVTTDLSEGAYSFESNGGTFNDRFQLIVANNETAIENLEAMTQRMQSEGKTYDLQGHRATRGEKGVLIRDNRKVMVK